MPKCKLCVAVPLLAGLGGDGGGGGARVLRV